MDKLTPITTTLFKGEIVELSKLLSLEREIAAEYLPKLGYKIYRTKSGEPQIGELSFGRFTKWEVAVAYAMIEKIIKPLNEKDCHIQMAVSQLKKDCCSTSPSRDGGNFYAWDGEIKTDYGIVKAVARTVKQGNAYKGTIQVHEFYLIP